MNARNATFQRLQMMQAMKEMPAKQRMPGFQKVNLPSI